MNNQFQENNVSYEEFEKSLSVMIFERAKGEIPKDICEIVAKLEDTIIKCDGIF